MGIFILICNFNKMITPRKFSKKIKFILTLLIVVNLYPVFFFIGQKKEALAQGYGVPSVESNVGYLTAIGTISASSVVTAKATALTELKEYILDGLLYALINIVIQQLSESLITWIKSGFNGSPGFITNPESFFLGVANRASGAVIAELGANFLCEPFRPSLQFKLNFGLDLPQYRKKRVECTLMGVLNNAQGFSAYTQGQFDVGGMAGLLSISQPQNNPYGAFIYASAEVQAEGLRQKQIQEQIAGWNRGFKSLSDTVTKANGQISKIIKTPGTVIENQLNDSLDSGKRRIEAADEISEIIGALVGQLLTTVISGVAGGNGGDDADTNNDYFGTAVPPCAKDQISSATSPCLTVVDRAPFTMQACPAGAQEDPITGKTTVNGTVVDCQIVGRQVLPDCPEGQTSLPGGGSCVLSAGVPPVIPPWSDTGMKQDIEFNLYAQGVVAYNGLIGGTDCTVGNPKTGITYPASNAIDGSDSTYNLSTSGTAKCGWSMQISPTIDNLIKQIDFTAWGSGSTYGFHNATTVIINKTADGVGECVFKLEGSDYPRNLMVDLLEKCSKPIKILNLEIYNPSNRVEMTDVRLTNYLLPVITVSTPSMTKPENEQPDWKVAIRNAVTATNPNTNEDVTTFTIVLKDGAGITVPEPYTNLKYGSYKAHIVATDSKNIKSKESVIDIRINQVITIPTGGGGGGPPAPVAISGNCYVSPTTINSTDSAAWRAVNVTGGNGAGTYTYAWSGGSQGTAQDSGNSDTHVINFTNSGTSDITVTDVKVTISSGGQTSILPCQTLTVRPIVVGPPVAIPGTVSMNANQTSTNVSLSFSGGTLPARIYINSVPSAGTLRDASTGAFITSPGTLVSNIVTYYPNTNPGAINDNLTFHVVDDAGRQSNVSSVNITRPQP